MTLISVPRVDPARPFAIDIDNIRSVDALPNGDALLRLRVPVEDVRIEVSYEVMLELYAQAKLPDAPGVLYAPEPTLEEELARYRALTGKGGSIYPHVTKVPTGTNPNPR